MSKTFDQGREEIAKLCKYFATNRQAFFAPGVKEAHVRQSLIDPFFEALGWDMRNTAMVAPQYREVVTEDSLEIEGQQKAPDYTFRVGTLPKFYTEAKKCGININADPGPAYQLRRYGWSAKVPLSILTDFEELGVYDCSQRPRPVDKASYGRIQYFRSEEYPDRWRELWEIFSREAVWAGAYDKFAASKRKRGTSEVDSEFLKEIEGWRDSLARNIALRNLYLGYDDLNTAVQRTIDRIIFLRMAEDRGSESYGQLLKLCERPGIYARFVGDLCRKADEKYNSGIFHFKKEEGIAESPDHLTPKLQIDDKVFKPILQSLYFENGSPYHFGVLPVEILGTVYERFLGKVIRLTAEHRAKVEEKPEVRKAGGVYYTPAYIVDYIVKNTVGKMMEGKSPAQLSGGKNGQPLRVLDMACGSGSFLLGAYQCLLDHSLKWYLANRPEKHKDEVYLDSRGKYWRLTIAEKKRILITHIFGVDIDLQAVEVSKLSLLLKVLEGETDETVGKSRQLFHERALPNLSNNIKCGNSLIGPDYFSGRLIPDPDEMKRVNPFDWNREFPEAMKYGGFDCVIGNPPWGADFSLKTRHYLATKFNISVNSADSFVLFIVQSLLLTKKDGLQGFIVPSSWLYMSTYTTLRKYLLSEYKFQKLLLFRKSVFENAVVETCVEILQQLKFKNNEFELVEVKDEPALLTGKSLALKQNMLFNSEEANFLQNDSSYEFKLFSKIASKGIPFRDLALIVCGLTPYRKGKGKPLQTQSIVENKSFDSDHKIDKTYRQYIMGRDFHRYNWKIQESRWISYGDWLAEPRYAAPFNDNTKIVIRQTADSIIAQIDTRQYLSLKNVHNVRILDENIDYSYLLGLLNSKLMTWWYRQLIPEIGRVFAEVKVVNLEKLPIRTIDFSNSKDKTRHDRMVELVNSMLKMHKQLPITRTEHEKMLLQRQIESTDREIDKMVYELYGLTEEEIKIVEDGTAK